MSTLMEDDIKRWTAMPKTALVLGIIQGKTTVSEASRAFDLNPSFGYRTVAHLLGCNMNTVQRIFQLRGWQVRKRPVVAELELFEK